jgi:hypothetical protein
MKFTINGFSQEKLIEHNEMKKSPQQAIKAFCKSCIYDPENGGTWTEQVEGCTVVKCELYEHRPLTMKTRKKMREKYLASLTPAEREIAEERSKAAGERMAKLRNSQLTEA